jgi:C4-dicarboxylate-specific signal transduction histidine kinase
VFEQAGEFDLTTKPISYCSPSCGWSEPDGDNDSRFLVWSAFCPFSRNTKNRVHYVAISQADLAKAYKKLEWRPHREILDTHQPYRDFVYSAFNESGSPVYVRVSGKPVFGAKGNFLGYRGTGTGITANIRADHAEEELRKAQMEFAHVTRVTTLGELTASIAHQVSQPLAGVVANAEACLSWLRRGTPDVDAACRSVEWVIDDGNRQVR